MTTVFIGGSRAVSRLNPVIRERLDDLMSRSCTILIGDANGADRAVQQYFAERGYRSVIVYCMDRCRNNVGSWETRKIQAPGRAKDFAYYATKDHAMAQDAKCGVMLWDGASKGTLNNIQNLLRAGKKTLVYLSIERTFTKLNDQSDFDALLKRCNPTMIASALEQLARKTATNDQLHLSPLR